MTPRPEGPNNRCMDEPQPSPAPPVLPDPVARIVLVEPEIPNNTGNIGRTCVATGCALHLVHPLGFDIDEKACRRAGLDYWPRLDMTEHDDLEAYQGAHPIGERTWLLSARAPRSIHHADLQRGDHFVFGRESVGLPDDLTRSHPEQCLSVPLVAGERSLNLSTAVASVVSVLIGRLLERGEVAIDEQGRLDPNAIRTHEKS